MAVRSRHLSTGALNYLHMLMESVKNLVLELIFPSQCFGCGKEGGFLCADCREKLYFIPPSCFICKKLKPGFGRIPAGRTCESCRKNSQIYAYLSPLSYNGISCELIHGLKYRRITSLDAILARILAEYLSKFAISFPENSVVIPIPMHRSRLRVRGFNQSELIANHLGELINLGVESRILQKTKKTDPQVGLSGEKRRNNITGSFSVTNPTLIKQRDIILVDDVKTTGATLEEAARALKNAGAGKIWAVTVAH